MNGQLVLFALMATIAVVCALGVVIMDNPVRSALCLVLVLFSVAVLFFTLHAVFVGAVQIIVYAGAIMVLFIFVIMLLNLGTGEIDKDRMAVPKWAAIIGAGATLAVIAAALVAVPSTYVHPRLADHLTGPDAIGFELFQANWLFPFEVISILLLVAAIGAVMLAKKRI
jgi:NADH-quinone oxidoreductase subunit J